MIAGAGVMKIRCQPVVATLRADEAGAVEWSVLMTGRDLVRSLGVGDDVQADGEIRVTWTEPCRRFGTGRRAR